MTLGFAEHIFDVRLGLSLLWRRRFHLAVVLAISVAASASSMLLAPPTFEAKAAFTAASVEGGSRSADVLRSLAGGQLAFLGARDGLTSAAIYPQILTSSRLLQEALSQKVPQARGGVSSTFAERFGFGGPDSAIAMARAIANARSQLSVGIDQISGLIEVKYRTRDPEIAAQFVAALLECLSTFNTTVRQSQARSVKEFLDRRIKEVMGDLARAENALSEFRARNVRFTSAPRLGLEESRLEREVRLIEALYQTLAQHHELARIDEARDTPTLTIVEPPLQPALPSGPGLLSRVGLVSVLSLLCATLWFTRSAWAQGAPE